MNLRQSFILLGVSITLSTVAQPKVNYDEDAIDPYVLPEILVDGNGQTILTIDDWEKNKRRQILTHYENDVYGIIPHLELRPTSIEIIEKSDSALNNNAIRKQIALKISAKEREITVNILLYLPKDIKSPPVFIGYNFYGNQTVINDQRIVLPNSWIRNNEEIGIFENRASEESRGKRSSRWPVSKIISEGFGLATVYYGDVDPDKNDFSDGIHSLSYTQGQKKPADNEWGSISAWAWGISMVRDYLNKDMLTLDSKFILLGHSRLGKTSLWAGALDPKFDVIISNNSGCGGSALFRRKFGETIAIINKNFPHWFSNNFNNYNDHEELLPIDQHMLIALIAPRPVYIASAEGDRWADPKGEYLAGHKATPVFELYGEDGLRNPEPPKTNTPIHNTIGYHIRTGKHDVTDYDWEQFMKFAHKHLRK